MPKMAEAMKSVHLSQFAESLFIPKNPNEIAKTAPNTTRNPQQNRVTLINFIPQKVMNIPTAAKAAMKGHLFYLMKSQMKEISSTGQAYLDWPLRM